MRITENVHLIRKEFQVTPVVKRYVNIYMVEGDDGCYLIDSGVSGTEQLIEEYLQSIGKTMKDIKGVFLTHSHPDHIGAANQINNECGCVIYAPKKELSWIENIDNQFEERPIPNFYNLLSQSVKVDKAVEDGMIFEVEKDITIKCTETLGHSHGSMSYLLNEEIIFIGDAVPVVNDIPIFVNYEDTVNSINLLRNMKAISYYCPAWDEVYDETKFEAITNESLKMLERLKQATLEVEESNASNDIPSKVKMILEKAGLIQFAGNPLVIKSIEACYKER